MVLCADATAAKTKMFFNLSSDIHMVPGGLGPDTNSVGVPECPAGTLCATV